MSGKAVALTGARRVKPNAKRRTVRRLGVFCCECGKALEAGQRVRVEYIATAGEARTPLWRNKSFTGSAYHFPLTCKKGAR